MTDRLWSATAAVLGMGLAVRCGGEVAGDTAGEGGSYSFDVNSHRTGGTRSDGGGRDANRASGGVRPSGGTTVGIASGVGGGPGGAGGTWQTGGAPVGSFGSCMVGVATGDGCDPVVDKAVCDRTSSASNPRTCVCEVDGMWACTAIGVAGAGGVG